MNLVVAAKITSLQRCVARVCDAHSRSAGAFRTNRDLQDVVVLNLIRACELAIDLAAMSVRARRLGLPNESRELFAVLERENCLPPELAARLKAMVGFRNLAVHQYRDLDFAIVEQIIQQDLDGLLAFARLAGLLLGAIEGREEG